MVQFYAPWCGHCKNLTPEYKKAASILKGIVNLAVVDAIDEKFGQKLAGDYGVQGFPTIKIFVENQKPPQDYQGSRDVNGLLHACMKGVETLLSVRMGQSPPPSGDGQENHSMDASKAETLTSENFSSTVYDSEDIWMVAFIAPWCGHCKNLLPEWNRAAGKVEGQGAHLGIVDATVHTDLAGEYGVKSFPTIKIFPGGKNKNSSMAKDYQGPRTASDIVRAALEEVDRSGAPPDIPELTSKQLFEKNCIGKSKLCILAALPHILESSAEKRNKYKGSLQKVAKSFRGQPFSFVWFEGSSQPDLEEKLELTFGFPAIAALSLDKNVYAVFRGSFNEKSIATFLHSITTGRATTNQLNVVPNILDVEEWDGKDGVPIEEESLADIMGEDWNDEF